MRQKQILIIGGDNGGGSAGDQIMCEAACDFFVKAGFKVYTDAQSLDWQSPISGVTTILQLRKDVYNTNFRRIVKSFLKLYRIIAFPIFCRTKRNVPFFLHGNEFKTCFQNSDIILFAGCGGLTDKYPITVLMWWSLIKAALKCSKPVYISGVGIGPIHSPICKSLIRKIINHVNYITVRDAHVSYDWVKKLSKLNNFDWVPDDACFYIGNDKYYIPSSLIKGRLIGINIMNAAFPSDILIKTFCHELSSVVTDADRFCLIPVTHEDSEVLNRIVKYLSASRCIVIPPISPSATKHVVSQLDIMISCRYHGCVFGVSQGIPTIGLYAEEYWKDKNNGVLEMFGCSNSAFSVSNITNGDFRNKVTEFLDNPEPIKLMLNEHIQVLKGKAYMVHKMILKNYE